ncbi:MAG: hypothetical protein E7295_11185 [Lachnospiraceae bacterium]|jgi:hypothetical protein|nr:hypothetical protein [Lachnospiraceae bacterium]
MKKVRKSYVVICIIMVFLLASCSESSGSLQGQETEASGETEVTQQTESVQETESSGETDGELAFLRDQIVTPIISVKQNNGDNMYICGAF